MASGGNRHSLNTRARDYLTGRLVCGGRLRGWAGGPVTDYEHTQSTKAGAPGVDPGQLITESRLFPQRQTDVATGAPCCDRKVNADRVLFGGERRLKRSWYRGIEPTQERGVRTTPASTRGHMWMGARTRTHELIGANRSLLAISQRWLDSHISDPHFHMRTRGAHAYHAFPAARATRTPSPAYACGGCHHRVSS